MKLTYRPIDEWPGELRSHRVTSPFQADWSATMRLLAHEVDMLASGGRYHTHAVLQVAVDEGAIRQDGQLRAGRRGPEHPGVILTFEHHVDGTPYRFSADKFLNWRHNVRAIALGMEALRKVERYGLGTGDEQYRGFQALPPGMPMPAAKMTVEKAARFIAEQGHPEGVLNVAAVTTEVIADPNYRTVLFRAAATRLHPDQGGDPDLFRRLVEARDLLDAQ